MRCPAAHSSPIFTFIFSILHFVRQVITNLLNVQPFRPDFHATHPHKTPLGQYFIYSFIITEKAAAGAEMSSGRERFNLI